MFKDHFSQHAHEYVQYRPQYPPELYSYLSTLTAEHKLAWDCGTGNGQAAWGLAEFYDEVVATDPSEQQISHAFAHPKIQYRIMRAEEASFSTHSVDLITVANALHWFDFDTFYDRVHKVLKPTGCIAVWAYKLPQISPTVDTIVRHLHDEMLGSYWLPENRLVEQGYRTLPFPFAEIKTPDFYCVVDMTLDRFLGFLHTWSAMQRYIRLHGVDPLDVIGNQLRAVWAGNGDAMPISWKLMMRVGRVS